MSDSSPEAAVELQRVGLGGNSNQHRPPPTPANPPPIQQSGTLPLLPGSIQSPQPPTTLGGSAANVTTSSNATQLNGQASGPPSSLPSSTPPKHNFQWIRWTRIWESHPIYQMLLEWLPTLTSTALFILTIIYAFSTTQLLRTGLTVESASHAILVLTVLSQMTKIGMNGIMDEATNRLKWTLLSTRRGIAFLDYLALNQDTSKWGLIILIFSKRKAGHRYSAIRLVFVLFVSVLSVILLSDVSSSLHFVSEPPFRISAGVGDFNASWVIEAGSTAAIQFQTDINHFLTDTARARRVEPVIRGTSICRSDDPLRNTDACRASYFIAGGLELVTPWPSKNKNDTGKTSYTIYNVQGLHLDFSFAELEGNARFDGTKDCVVYGGESSAVQVCVTKSDENIIYAKLVHCPITIQGSCINDTTWHASTGWTTAMTAYRRRATVHYARYNETILSVSDLSAPSLINNLSAADLLIVYNATFIDNSNGFGCNTPGYQFIAYLSNKLTLAETSSPAFFAAASNLRNLIALPLYYFTPLYISPYTAAQGPLPTSIIQGVPSELYVDAALSNPVYHVSVAPWTVWLYTGVGALVLLTCLAVLFVGSFVRTTANGVPETTTTTWPVLDFVANCREGPIGEEDKLIETVKGLRGQSSREVAKGVEGLRLRIREHGQGHTVNRHISTTGGVAASGP